MMRVYQKVSKFTTTLSYFATRRYTFSNDNVRHLISISSDQDKELFNMNVQTINWRDYLEVYIRGAREYILKESWDTLPYAQIKWRRYVKKKLLENLPLIIILLQIILVTSDRQIIIHHRDFSTNLWTILTSSF